MPVTREALTRMAELAKLSLSKEEMDRLLRQLSRIVDYVQGLPELPDTEPSEGEAPGRGAPRTLRPDEPGDGLETGEAVRIAPAQRDGFLSVPAFLPEGDRSSPG